MNAQQRRQSGQQPDDGKKSGVSLVPPRIDVFWLILYVILLAACAAVMIVRPDLLGHAFIALVVTLAMLPIGLRTGQDLPTGPTVSQNDQIDRLAAAVESMTQESGLSEAAKRVLHRRQERELLRREIERDIADGDWDAAMVLVKELAERFGYRADAEEFRTRIERVRAESLERTVTEAIDALDELIRQRRWTDAYAEAARITRLYPDSHRIDGLKQRVDEARDRYKHDLERRFLMAAERDEIDNAMDLLKELDIYLTEDEAERFREVARGVIGKARDNLGVRFKLSLQDRNWVAALEFGERIISDFPNTRMAEEVRGMLDTLRTQAASMQHAGASTSSSAGATS